jgi:high affinity sulfate transporter 1
VTTAPVRSRTGWFAPTLRNYRRQWLLPDLLAGVAAGAVVIPQAMAYATIANLPVQVGLYTCVLPMVVYALLGGSRAMSVSTTSTIATLTATTFVSAGVAANSDDVLGDLAALTLLVGVILIVARLLKLGSLVEYISQATLTGIKIGVGATVAVGQLPKLLGVESNFTGYGFLRSLTATIEAVPGTNVPTLVLSIVVILVLVLMARFTPRIPGQLVVVVGSIALIAFGLGSGNAGIDLIAPVPSGLARPVLPALGELAGLVGGALAISVMVFLESAAVARSIRKAGEEQIDSNRELLAAGAVNLAAAFFNSMPSAGGFSQSAVNQRAGARSQLAALTTALLAVLVAIFLGPVLSNLPQATLAAMVIVAVAPLIDPRPLVRLWRISKPDFWVATVTAVLGLTTGLLAAVAVGVVLTLILVLRELNRTRIRVIRASPQEIVIRVDSALFTANVAETLRRVDEEVEKAGRPPIVVLELPAQRTLTITILDALADFDCEFAGTDTTLTIAGLPDEAVAIARKTSWYRRVEAEGRTRGLVEDEPPA